MKTKVDMTGVICFNCYRGSYQETSVFSDIDGTLECPHCGDTIERWKECDEQSRSESSD